MRLTFAMVLFAGICGFTSVWGTEAPGDQGEPMSADRKACDGGDMNGCNRPGTMSGGASAGAVARLTRVFVEKDPSTTEYAFFRDGKEIAVRSCGHDHTDCRTIRGTIPDGTIGTYDGDELIFEGSYRGNRLNGPARVYQKGRLIAERNYVDDEIRGQEKGYHPNGKLEHEGFWKECAVRAKRGKSRHDGLAWCRTGTRKRYSEEGVLVEETNLVDSRLQGPHKTYHPNGRLNRDENYKNDRLDGLCQYFGEDGTLLARKSFKNGREDGWEEIYWPGTNQLNLRRRWKNGVIVPGREEEHPHPEDKKP